MTMERGWQPYQQLPDFVWISEAKEWRKKHTEQTLTISNVGTGIYNAVSIAPENLGVLQLTDMFNSEENFMHRKRLYGGSDVGIFKVGVDLVGPAFKMYVDDISENSTLSKSMRKNKVISFAKVGVFRCNYDQEGQLEIVAVGGIKNKGLHFDFKERTILAITDNAVIDHMPKDLSNLYQTIPYNERFFKILNGDDKVTIVITRPRLFEGKVINIEDLVVTIPEKIDAKKIRCLLKQDGTDWLGIFNQFPAKFSFEE